MYSSEKTFDLAMLNLRKDGSASKEPLGLNQEFPPLFSFSSLFLNFFHVGYCANLGFVGSLGVIERESLLLAAVGSWVLLLGMNKISFAISN